MSLFVRHTAHSERQLNEICWAVIPQEVESIKTPTKPGRLSSHFGTTCTTWKFHLLNGIMIKLYFSCFHRVFLCFPGIFHSVFLCSTVFLCFPMFSWYFTFAFHVRVSLPSVQWQDYAPLILENGLDPGCGHLTKGTWLGGAGPGTGLCHKNTAGWLVVWNIYFSSYKLVIIPLTIGISPIDYIVKLDLFSIIYIYIYGNFIIPTDELHHFSEG